MSPAHAIRLIEHSQVVYRIEHSTPVRAIVATLLTTLVALAVAAFFNRRRIAWRAYVDAPITLDADQAKTMGTRVKRKIYVTDNGVAGEFRTPLTFTFPGRDVRDATVIDGAGDNPGKILFRPKREDPGPQTAATRPGRLLRRRDDPRRDRLRPDRRRGDRAGRHPAVGRT